MCVMGNMCLVGRKLRNVYLALTELKRIKLEEERETDFKIVYKHAR